MQHFILTRMATGNPTEQWLKHRIKLFNDYCVPSITGQTNQNFKWFLTITKNTPKWFIDEIQKLENTVIIVNESTELYPNWPVILKSYVDKSQKLLTTRFDNDDMLHKDFVQYTQKFARTLPNKTLIDAAFGYKMDFNTKKCYEISQLQATPFCSFIEDPIDFQTIMCGDHSYLHHKYSILKIVESRTKLYIQICHENNLKNTVGNSNRASINLEIIKKDYGL